MKTILSIKSLSKVYKIRTGFFKSSTVTALKPISFDLIHGQTLAVVGEAGSGKSTLAKLLAGAETPTAGMIFLNGQQLDNYNLKQRTGHIRLIFQDANKSLNPNITVGRTLSEVLRLNTNLSVSERKDKIGQTLTTVGLLPEHRDYFPHMFSGGQLQRVALARALILDPQILVLDEALASLDPSVRAQIINLLFELQDEKNLTFILITHHLGLVKHMSDHMLVLHKGELVEQGKTKDVFSQPSHEHTKRLIATQSY